ncbi:MAG: hypothetical protein QF909_17260 [SAR202 cluster bacterium]|nr:hypothetical protein [SAR202 cluster bacterium]
MSVIPFATTDPLISRELRAPFNPAWIVSLPRSAAKIPEDSTVNAKTEATTTNAIMMIAVSSPVTPRSCLAAAPSSRTIFIINSGQAPRAPSVPIDCS